ncbi:MAG: ABC transporter permease [Polyangiaceae bacterium]
MLGPFLSGVKLALRAVRKNVLRSFLTVLGILIGVMAVVTVTALADGVRSDVAAKLESLGSNFLIVLPQNSNVSGARGSAATGFRLTEEDGRAVAREAVSISAVAPGLSARAQAVVGERNWSTTIIGSNLAYFKVRNWDIAHGETWSASDEAVKSKVCVIGSTIRDKLFPNEDPVGRRIRFGRYVYRVVGILETKGQAPFGGDQDDIILMPISSMRSRILRTPPGFAGVLLMSASSADTTARAVAQVDAILRQRHGVGEGREPDFTILTQQKFRDIQFAIYGVLTLLMIGVAGISLVVGGIGIMNIMLVSVTERTREIGIRMAIGARENDIRTQFLVEAVVLALLGGVLGIAFGALTIAGLASLFSMPMKMSGTALAVSVGTSAMTGIGFGFFPARRAARLDPIEALRHE